MYFCLQSNKSCQYFEQDLCLGFKLMTTVLRGPLWNPISYLQAGLLKWPLLKTTPLKGAENWRFTVIPLFSHVTSKPVIWKTLHSKHCKICKVTFSLKYKMMTNSSMMKMMMMMMTMKKSSSCFPCCPICLGFQPWLSGLLHRGYLACTKDNFLQLPNVPMTY